MIRNSLIVLAILFMSLKAFAVDYTITLSASQEEGLQYATDTYNAEQVKANPEFTPITKAAYLTNRIASVVDSYTKKKLEDKLQELAPVYSGLSEADRIELELLLKQKAGL